MHHRLFTHIVITLLLLLTGSISYLYGQPQSGEDIRQAERYLDSRLKALTRYADRSDRIQQRLLKKLQRQEQRMTRRLAKTDSSLYRQYLQNPLTYDSISKIPADSGLARKAAQRANGLVDSLKYLQKFAGKGTGAGLPSADGRYNEQLTRLQQQLNIQQQVKEQLQKKGRQLENWATTQSIPGLKKIQQQVYYAGEQMKAWRQVAYEPDAAEEKALEYLQGLQGFDPASAAAAQAYPGLSPDAGEEELRKAGYQTKKMVSNMMQKNMGNQAQALQQQLSQQVQDYQGKLNGKVQTLQEKKNQVKEALQDAKETKEQLRQTKTPGFRSNPQRCKPFIQRWHTQYTLQSLRATADGLRPALLEAGASLRYKHNSRLSIGAGFALPIGLGNSWQELKFSYEGVSLRSFIEGEWRYGIALQGGYERTFGPRQRPYVAKEDPAAATAGGNGWQQAFGAQQQAAYIGIKKAYRINKKWNGTLMLGYNFLHRHGYNRSPLMLRLGWEK